jgi:hypothetical protein
MNTIERIFKFIEYKGISTNEFSKKTGVSNGYFAKQKASNANIGSQIIEKIVNNYPEISIDWLIMGQGEMLRTGLIQEVKTQPHPDRSNEIISVYKDLLREKDDKIERQNKRIWDLERELKDCKKNLAEIQESISSPPLPAMSPYELSTQPYPQGLIAAEPEVEYGKVTRKSTRSIKPRTP